MGWGESLGHSEAMVARAEVVRRADELAARTREFLLHGTTAHRDAVSAALAAFEHAKAWQ
jgi:hypothetical protein